MALCYLLSLNPTSYGILKNLRGSGLEVHLFHVKGGLECLLDDSVTVHRLSLDEQPDAVVEVMRAGEAGMVFTSSDAEISFLERFRRDLEDRVSLPLLPSDKVSLINNKYEFFRTAAALGIPSPRSYCLSCSEPDVEGMDLGWPRLVKPIFSQEWKTAHASSSLRGKKAIVVDGAADLRARIEEFRQFSPRLLAQEIIDTEEDGTYSFCCYSDPNGKVLWGFVTQKLLQYPERFGTAILCATADRPDIAAFGRGVVESLGISGISETEIAVDRMSGRLVVIEINTRHWMQHRLSNFLGVNISLLDFHYRNGNREQLERILRGATGFVPALWVDEMAYFFHLLKHLPGRALHLERFRGRKREFSLLEEGNVWPLLRIFVARSLARKS